MIGGVVLLIVFSKLNKVCCFGKLIFLVLKFGYLLYMEVMVSIGF